MTQLQTFLAAGRVALEAVAAREVTFRGLRVPALINEAGGDADRRGVPDRNLRVGSIMEIDAAHVVEAPRAGEFITDDLGRRHRIAIVGRRENVWRINCEPNS